MTPDQDEDYSHNAWLLLIEHDAATAAMAAHLLRKERDEAVQALADVRTLDESGFAWESGFFHIHDVKTCMCVVFNEEQTNFTGSTPDNARAKAAAWVRGLR